MTRFTKKLRRRQLDELLVKLRDIPKPPRGYIREIREAIEMSSYQLADRMGLSQSTIMDLESSERNGTITVKSLERVASSPGCKLVYAFVPDESLEAIVLHQAEKKRDTYLRAFFAQWLLSNNQQSQQKKPCL